MAAALAGLLIAASAAVAIEAPGLSSNPGPGPSTSRDWSFSWTTPTADPGFTFSHIEGGLDGAEGPLGASPATHLGLADGTHTFRVRAVQTSDGDGTIDKSTDAEVSFFVDATAPTLAVTLAGPLSESGWYRAPLTITRSTCTDGSGVGLPQGACVDAAWTTPGQGVTTDVTLADLLGNSTTVTAGPVNFDNAAPTPAEPSEPGPAALVAAEPTFRWTPGEDALSGVDRYVLQIRSAEEDGASFETIAVVQHTSGVGDYSATRDPDEMPEALPQREQLEWRVRTIDQAGNISNSTPARRLMIDSTIPPAPSITGGPLGPTRINTPTFSWDGTEDTYLWDLTRAGQELPVREGGGGATNVTLSQLPDGDYTFRVKQVTDAGQRSAEATRAFKIDTVAPAPPTIIVRPPFPTTGPATFGWTMEPGAYSRWTVIGAGGATALGPSDTPVPSVTLSTLAEGAFSFTVLQVDAAGNVSGTTVEPFTVIAPVLPPPPGATGNASLVSSLPRQNALRLRPRAGRTVPTRRPVLRWTRGPRGTTLYNLQIFRVSKKTRRLGTPIVSKIYSAFPRGRQFRAPKKKMLPGTCYVWRVWPYTGRRFTPKPLGISNFCVASRKVLLKKAAQAAANRRARLAAKR